MTQVQNRTNPYPLPPHVPGDSAARPIISVFLFSEDLRHSLVVRRPSSGHSLPVPASGQPARSLGYLLPMARHWRAFPQARHL